MIEIHALKFIGIKPFGEVMNAIVLVDIKKM